MPPRAEKKPSSSRLSLTDRNLIVDEIAEVTNRRHEDYVDAPEWGYGRRYMRLVGMMASLALPWLELKHTSHITRMIAYETASLARGGRKPQGLDEFMQNVRDKAGDEIDYIQTAKGELAPRYKKALDDVNKLEDKITVDPMRLRLSKSLRRFHQEQNR